MCRYVKWFALVGRANFPMRDMDDTVKRMSTKKESKLERESTHTHTVYYKNVTLFMIENFVREKH